jgi:hypothetical protein
MSIIKYTLLFLSALRGLKPAAYATIRELLLRCEAPAIIGVSVEKTLLGGQTLVAATEVILVGHPDIVLEAMRWMDCIARANNIVMTLFERKEMQSMDIPGICIFNSHEIRRSVGRMDIIKHGSAEAIGLSERDVIFVIALETVHGLVELTSTNFCIVQPDSNVYPFRAHDLQTFEKRYDHILFAPSLQYRGESALKDEGPTSLRRAALTAQEKILACQLIRDIKNLQNEQERVRSLKQETFKQPVLAECAYPSPTNETWKESIDCIFDSIPTNWMAVDS